MPWQSPRTGFLNWSWERCRGRSFILLAQNKRTKQKAPQCAGLRLHCVAQFIWELSKTRYAHKFVWNKFGRQRRPKGE